MRTIARVLLALVATAAIATAQGGDSWFVLDRFSGLNLYLDKTSLQPNQALKAENVQFSKPGTISGLSGLTKRVTLFNGPGSVLGLGTMRDFVNDSDRILMACSSYIYNSYGNSLASFDKSTAQENGGLWRTWEESTRVEDTLNIARASEFWRPGWWMQRSAKNLGTPALEYLVIDYIDDNNTIFLTTTPDSAYSHDADDAVHPILASQNLPVRFVNVEVDGTQQVVILQAGMEPRIYDGSSLSSIRYLGIADSGTVSWCQQYGASVYFVDNTKLGIYGINEVIYPNGYWLQLAYNAPYGDSSHWGHILRIDSAVVRIAVDTTQFVYWCRYGEDGGDTPSGGSLDSMRGCHYNLISAPMLREVLSEAETPLANVKMGGRLFTSTETDSMPAARSTDHVPHVVELTSKADTLLSTWVDSIIYNCGSTGDIGGPYDPNKKVCTSYVTHNTMTAMKGITRQYPVRTVLDSSGTRKIWTLGNIEDTSVNFTTSEWRLWKVTIPYAADGVNYGGRLYLAGDPQAPNEVYYSRYGQVGAFSPLNMFKLASNGDVFVGFAKIYNWLVIFQREHTYVLKGDPQDGHFPELALPDEGCIAIGTILEMDNKVLYLSTKGWRVFDGNTAQDFAMPIKPAVQAFPRVDYAVNPAYKHKASAANDAMMGNVWLSMAFASDTVNSGSFLYNYVDGSFSYSDEVYGAYATSAYFNDTSWLMFASADSAMLYTYGYTDSLDATGMDGNYMTQKWSTGWLDMGAPFQRKYISEGVMQATLSAPVTEGNGRPFYITMYRDNDTTSFFKDTINVWGLTPNGVHVDFETSWKLEPQTSVAWLRIEIEGTGLLVMDIQRIALRYRLDDDIVRRDVQGVRP